MEDFISKAENYASKIREYLKSNEWTLDSDYQESLLNDLRIEDILDIPPIVFFLREELEAIAANRQIDFPHQKQIVLEFLDRGDTTGLLLGTMYYMYVTIKGFWRNSDEEILYRLELCMIMLVEPDDLSCILNVIS